MGLILLAGTGAAGGGAGWPPDGTEFGTHGSGARPTEETLLLVTDLGAPWIRINRQLDGEDFDVRPYLDAGIDLVLTYANRDPADADTRYGTPAQWPRAGFPYRSRDLYARDLRNSLELLLPYLDRGSRLVVQCENEAGDVSFNNESMFWRGTTDDYLRQIEAFHDIVKGIDSRIQVVLTSFTSRALDVAIDPARPGYESIAGRLTRLMTEGRYDAVDLHFYGCAEDIPAKVAWVRERLPEGRAWITTECGGPDPSCPETPVSWRRDPEAWEREEARQVPLRLQLCADNGAAIALWFSLLDLHGETGWAAHLGLVDRRLGHDRRKPAYAALQSFVVSRR